MSVEDAFSDLGLFPAPSLLLEPSLRRMADDKSGHISLGSSLLARSLMSCDVHTETIQQITGKAWLRDDTLALLAQLIDEDASIQPHTGYPNVWRQNQGPQPHLPKQ